MKFFTAKLGQCCEAALLGGSLPPLYDTPEEAAQHADHPEDCVFSLADSPTPICVGHVTDFSNSITLYHGSPNQTLIPTYGQGNDRHDYGKGFYLTNDVELAREWSVCKPDRLEGWVHEYRLCLDGLRIFDFQQNTALAWLAELMKHREAADSRRYRMLSEKFVSKYGIDTDGYDIIMGWRADASYFFIAKEFVRDNIDVGILEELLSLGGLGIQYCIKSPLAYSRLVEVVGSPSPVDYAEFNTKFDRRDNDARRRMRALVDSDANKVTNVFSTLV